MKTFNIIRKLLKHDNGLEPKINDILIEFEGSDINRELIKLRDKFDGDYLTRLNKFIEERWHDKETDQNIIID